MLSHLEARLRRLEAQTADMPVGEGLAALLAYAKRCSIEDMDPDVTLEGQSEPTGLGRLLHAARQWQVEQPVIRTSG